jgi:hypothetical protein
VKLPTDDKNALEYALAYAERCWRLFPVRAHDDGVGLAGTPHLKGWPKRATCDTKQIERRWAKWPDAWVGIATGVESGLLVVDLDVKGGKDGIAAGERLAESNGGVGAGPIVITKSGGRRLYFNPGDVEYRDTAGKIGEGIDTRGDGGFVVAPPARGYSWSSEPNGTVPPVPVWLADLLTSSDAPQADEYSSSPVASSTLAGLLQNPPKGEGNRNQWLARVAGHYAKTVEYRDAYDVLVMDAANKCDRDSFDDDEVLKTAKSVWATEARKPSNKPEPTGKGRRPSVATQLVEHAQEVYTLGVSTEGSLCAVRKQGSRLKIRCSQGRAGSMRPITGDSPDLITEIPHP